MNYEEYVLAFNRGDDEHLVRTYFTPDFTFVGSSRRLDGTDQFLKFLTWAHDGVREIIRAQTVIRQGERLFAEIDMDFHASKDRPDFPFKPLKRGATTTVKFFVVYTLRGDRISYLKAATWPADYEVTRPPTASGAPRLGGGHAQRLAFSEYLTAFSAGNIEVFTTYYQPDVTLQLGSGLILRERTGIAAFYRKMLATVTETLTLHDLVADDHGLAADLTTTFVAHDDAPDFVIAPLRKGQAIRGRVYVHYALRDGLIADIKVARAGPMGEAVPREALEPLM